MKPEKLERASLDGCKLNLEALYRLAPSCFTEAEDDRKEAINVEKDGKQVRMAINFNTLRELLGDTIVDDNEELYAFTWPGKQAARREAAAPITDTLRPMPEDSEDWDKTENLYIEGDNLRVLKLLQKGYMGKVKMIYIDPPYNTGNDFVYHDDFAIDNEQYLLDSGDQDEDGFRYRKNLNSNGRFHSDWCSMIYSRLLVARSLLTEDGVIFISIDDHEVGNLRKICDEVFGESNFVASINWKGRGGRQDSKYYAVIHEYILCYAKNIDKFEAREEIKEGDVYPKYDEKTKRFYKTQLLRKWGSNSLRENRPNLYYPIIAPDGSQVYPTIFVENEDRSALQSAIEGRWRWSASTLEKARLEGRIELVKNKYGYWVGYERIYAPLEGEEKTKKYTTWIDDTSNGTDVLKQLFGGKSPFDYSKSPTLILHFLKMSNLNNNDLILDFFSGSATTAHAVMQLNAEDGGKRKYICVQLPEKTPEDSEARKAGYATIPEIAKERIRRAGRKIREDSPIAAQNLDTGFRVFQLDSGNFEDVEKSPNDYNQAQLDLFTDNIKANRTDLDLLFGAMLAWGVQLSLSMETEEVDGCKVYSVDGNSLVACFAEGITEKVVRTIAAKRPLRVLFRDSCFAEDKTKINIFESFKQQLDWDEREAMQNIRVI